MLRSLSNPIATATPWIAGLALVFLGAMAFALPPAPIRAEASEASRGFLVGHSRLIDNLAEQLAGAGYTFLAVDVGALREGHRPLWVDYLSAVDKRRFPVWGWIHAGKNSVETSVEAARSLPFAGIFIYGPGAIERANLLRSQRLPVEVIPVVDFEEPRPQGMRCAVAMDLDTFLEHGEEVEMPVLIADVLGLDEIEQARDAVGGNYLIARAPLAD